MTSQETRILNLIKENDTLMAHVGRGLSSIDIPVGSSVTPGVTAFREFSGVKNNQSSSPSNS